jgi:hypothetical protein
VEPEGGGGNEVGRWRRSDVLGVSRIGDRWLEEGPAGSRGGVSRIRNDCVFERTCGRNPGRVPVCLGLGPV